MQSFVDDKKEITVNSPSVGKLDFVSWREIGGGK
jgi:hypothetical protein